MLCEVRDSGIEQLDTVLEMPNSVIASIAEKFSDLARPVTMVHAKFLCFYFTNSTSSALLRSHGIKVMYGNSIFFAKSGFPSLYFIVVLPLLVPCFLFGDILHIICPVFKSHFLNIFPVSPAIIFSLFVPSAIFLLFYLVLVFDYPSPPLCENLVPISFGPFTLAGQVPFWIFGPPPGYIFSTFARMLASPLPTVFGAWHCLYIPQVDDKLIHQRIQK